MRRRFFVAAGIKKRPNPIDIITGSGRRGITHAYCYVCSIRKEIEILT
jgi:hypothetical protein